TAVRATLVPLTESPGPSGVGSGTTSFAMLKGRQFQEAKREVLTRFERDYFAALAEEAKGDVSEMARRAGRERARVRASLSAASCRTQSATTARRSRRRRRATCRRGLGVPVWSRPTSEPICGGTASLR